MGKKSSLTHSHIAHLFLLVVFCFFYCYHGLFLERKYELLAFVAATVVIVIYVVGNYVFDVVKGHDIPIIKTVCKPQIQQNYLSAGQISSKIKILFSSALLLLHNYFLQSWGGG